MIVCICEIVISIRRKPSLNVLTHNEPKKKKNLTYCLAVTDVNLDSFFRVYIVNFGLGFFSFLSHFVTKSC